jgi:nitrite reductase (NADH) small subunit
MSLQSGSHSTREWHRVAALGDLEVGVARVVSVQGRSIGIVRLDDGVFALRNSCPHQGAEIFNGGVITGTMVPSQPGELVYGFEDQVIRCPLHGWEFDVRTGNAVFGISPKRVVVYPAEVRGEDVFVALPRAAGQ